MAFYCPDWVVQPLSINQPKPVDKHPWLRAKSSGELRINLDCSRTFLGFHVDAHQVVYNVLFRESRSNASGRKDQYAAKDILELWLLV